MLKQSSLGESAHWALSFAAELRVEARCHPVACIFAGSSSLKYPGGIPPLRNACYPLAP